MAQYTVFSAQDIRRVSSAFGLAITDFKALMGGATNSSYYLYEGQAVYVLTVLDNKSTLEANRLCNLLLYLENHDFKTTRLVPLIDGSGFLFQEGDHYIIIKKYLDGQIANPPNRTQLSVAGHKLAQLHQIPAPVDLPEIHGYEKNMIPPLRQFPEKVDAAYRTWLYARLDEFATQQDPTLPSGLIHGDLFYDNVLFQDDGGAVIIDFELACHRPFVLDVGMALVGLCFYQGSVDLERARAVVQGYQKIRPITLAEQAKLQAYSVYSAVLTSTWRYWKFHVDTPTPERFEKYKLMVQAADRVAALAPDEFINQIFDD